MAAAVVADCGKPLVAGVMSWACDSFCYCSLGSLALALAVCFEDYLYLTVKLRVCTRFNICADMFHYYLCNFHFF